MPERRLEIKSSCRMCQRSYRWKQEVNGGLKAVLNRRSWTQRASHPRVMSQKLKQSIFCSYWDKFVSQNCYFSTGDTKHAFPAIQFSPLIEANRADLTWASIPPLFAVTGGRWELSQHGLIWCRQLCAQIPRRPGVIRTDGADESRRRSSAKGHMKREMVVIQEIKKAAAPFSPLIN